MTIQESILKQFKTKFPKNTLQQSSKLTGLSTSRLFRLFNGLEMKLVEYEMFTKILNCNVNQTDSPFINLAFKCLNTLSTDELNIFEAQLSNSLNKYWLAEQISKSTDKSFLQIA